MNSQSDNKQLQPAEYWLMIENKALQNRPVSLLGTQSCAQSLRIIYLLINKEGNP